MLRTELNPIRAYLPVRGIGPDASLVVSPVGLPVLVAVVAVVVVLVVVLVVVRLGRGSAALPSAPT